MMKNKNQSDLSLGQFSSDLSDVGESEKPLHVMNFLLSKQEDWRAKDSVSFQIKLACEVERIWVEHDKDKDEYLSFDEV